MFLHGHREYKQDQINFHVEMYRKLRRKDYDYVCK